MIKNILVYFLFFTTYLFSQNNYQPYLNNQIGYSNFIKNISPDFSVNNLTVLDKSDSNSNFLKQTQDFNSEYKIDFTSLLLKEQLEDLNLTTPFDVIHNPTLERYIRVFLSKRMESLPKLIYTANYYFPIFESYLDKYNLPLEIKYLAIVESALNPTAVSKSGAKGLWQFMYITGKHFGLQIDSYVDERLDILKSTEAACKYLSFLYNTFDNWDLALAAYNSGAGNVKKAIKRSGGKTNYWEIRKFLPKETRGYLPAFYATFYLFEYADYHNLKSIKTNISTLEFDTIHLKKSLSFKTIQNHVPIDLKTLKALNPQYKKEFIPFSKSKKYILKLPLSLTHHFIENEELLYKTEKKENEINQNNSAIEINQNNSYIVQKGDNLAKIAIKHNLTVEQLKKWNGLQTNYLIEYQRLVVDNKINFTKKKDLNSNSFSPNISPNFKDGEEIISKPEIKLE